MRRFWNTDSLFGALCECTAIRSPAPLVSSPPAPRSSTASCSAGASKAAWMCRGGIASIGAPDRRQEVQRLGQVIEQRRRQRLVAGMALEHPLWAVELPIGVHEDRAHEVLGVDLAEPRRLDLAGPRQHRRERAEVHRDHAVDRRIAQRGPCPAHVHRRDAEVRVEVRVHERVALALAVPGRPALVLPVDRGVVGRELGLQLSGDRHGDAPLSAWTTSADSGAPPEPKTSASLRAADQVAPGTIAPRASARSGRAEQARGVEAGEVRGDGRRGVGEAADGGADRSASGNLRQCRRSRGERSVDALQRLGEVRDPVGVDPARDDQGRRGRRARGR